MIKATVSIVERIDAGIASLVASGAEPSDVVMDDTVYATFMVQGEADTFESQPTTIRNLPIVRVRDGLKSAVRAKADGLTGRASYIIA